MPRHDTRFADPGGRSALRAASRHNPRTLQCDRCADAAEGFGDWEC